VTAAGALADVTVDDGGLRLSGPPEALVDVLFDGRRIWSFRVGQSGEREGAAGPWRVRWPGDLVPFLRGHAHVTVREHAGSPAFDDEVRLGTSDERIEVTDRRGRPLVVDGTGRLAIAFEARDGAGMAPLVEALEHVVRLLNEAGVAAFPAYGTLLGTVRDGAFIAHDSDADVGYISRFDTPVDVIRESFRLQRELERAGYDTIRYSGGAFKVLVREDDDLVRGLDVFGGAMMLGHLMLMGELYVPFERSWLLPLGTAELAGRPFPVPAEPERMLAAMYGPSWRVPDPAFKFTTPESTNRRLNGWFRGTRVNRAPWDRRYAASREGVPQQNPHQLARELHRREPAGCTVVDLGCGRGQDAFWLARQGHRVFGLDYAEDGFAGMQREAAEHDVPVSYHPMNLLDLRHAMAWGARISRVEGPRAVLARHVIDATNVRGRRHAWRLAKMALGGGGRMYAEFVVGPPGNPALAGTLLTPLDPAVVADEVEQFGGRVVGVEHFETTHTGQPPIVGDRGGPAPACRMVMEWTA
jgi:hypothetical protein